MEGVITHLHLLAYFIVMVSMLKTEKIWKWFFHTSLGASIIVSIYGFLQLGGVIAINQSNVRLDAKLGNASYLAIYMVFNIFLALYYFAKEKEWYRWFYLPLIISQAVIVYHTATRGAILGLIGGSLLTLALMAWFSEKEKIKIFAGAFLGLMLVLLGGFWLAKDANFIKKSPVLNRFASISLEETTTQSRFIIWGMSWEGFKEKPLLGWGPENYNLVFNKYYEPILYKQEAWFDRAHNVFFDRLTTNGILGLLAYLGLFASAFYYLLFKKNNSADDQSDKKIFGTYGASIFTGLLAAYLFHNLFVFDNLISFLLFFAVLGYIHHRAVNLETDLPSGDVAIENDYKKQVGIAVIVVATILTVYAVNVPAFLANRSLLETFEQTARNNPEGAFEAYKKSLSYNSFGSTEAREQLINFAGQVIASPNLDQDFKTKVLDFAVSEMKKQIESSPQDIRYMAFLSTLYNRAGQYDLAIEQLKKAIEISPKKQALYFELGGAYFSKEEYENAADALKIAFEEEKTFDTARNMYAVALVFAGDDDLAEQILKERYGSAFIADQRFANAYAKIKRFDKVALVWKKMIEKNPGNAQYRVNLAATYLETGERNKAIEQLQKAIEIESTFKEQGESLISEIRAGRRP